MARLLRRSAIAAATVFLMATFQASGQTGAIVDTEDLPPPTGEELLAIVNEHWTGDLDGIRERRLLRVITTYNRTNFFIDHGQGRGLEFESMARFAAWFNDRHTKDDDRGGPAVAIRVVFVPVPREELIPALLDGRGDVIAAGLTATEGRTHQVQSAKPYIERVDEVLVRHKDAPALATLDDLSGKTLLLTRGTSYIGNARALSERFVAAGRAPIRIIEAPPYLETEDVLELVNAGAARYTIADDHLAEVWASLLPDIVVQDDVQLVSGGTIAWAVRPDALALKAALDAFTGVHLADRSSLMTIYRRYFEDTHFIDQPFGPGQRDRIRQLAPFFQSAAERAGFEWLLMAAQGFQESRLDARARSRSGARGVMQLMPATARELGVRDIDDAEQNIHGGVRYMEQLREAYFNDPAIAPEEQIRFTLAAYNAGPRRISLMRQQAAAEGLDPNKWFGHVEHVVRRRIGSSPARYVANIFAYYTTYSLAADLLDDRGDELTAFREALGQARP
ncbi:transglycosylase SLT domain-containing protein [Elioraea sp.]|uniref:transglycosylase SLT domain-containing protein n=1 Tax=Elioraea sp. TaxID=2185103 RepID=UPI0025C3A480|nr:transporter substrate-binding domain-containing protein [Elioraea sp.]